jgi:NADH-quinone oxidoreductase subunit L
MGGLKEKMPWTRITFLVSCLAISGIPIFSGFFSKDEILLSAYANASEWTPGLNYALWIVGVITAFFTAFYMFRLYYLVFEGKFRGDHHTWTHYVTEHWIMTFPLIVLAVGAAFGGFLGIPHVFHMGPHVLGEWLEPIIATSDGFGGEFFVGARPELLDEEGHVLSSVEWGLMAASVVVALAGILFARALYKDGPSQAAESWRARLSALYNASLAKYWVDELYDFVVVRPLRFLGGICYQVGDQLIVDGLGVSGVAGTVGALGNRARTWHNGNVRRYLTVLLFGGAIVVGTVYLNPQVVEFGPSKIHPIDLGGLRPQLGAHPVKITVLGYTLPWPAPPTAPRPAPGQAPPPDAPADAPGGGR